MLSSVEELKALIPWLKEQGVEVFKSGPVELVFSKFALLPASLKQGIEGASPQATELTPEAAESQRVREEERILFHSSG